MTTYVSTPRNSAYRSPEKFGGNYSITVTVDEAGVAGPYEVVLHDRKSGLPVLRQWSDESGVCVFTNIANSDYYATAFDHGSNPVNAAISDQLDMVQIR